MVLLSQKHGVNPAIPKCFYCQEDKNEIILAGKLRGDAEAPRGCVWDMEPCQKCRTITETDLGWLWDVDFGDGRGTRCAEPAASEAEAERLAQAEVDTICNYLDA